MVLVFVPSQKLRELAQQGKVGAGEGQVEVLPRKLSCPPKKGSFSKWNFIFQPMIFLGDMLVFKGESSVFLERF